MRKWFGLSAVAARPAPTDDYWYQPRNLPTQISVHDALTIAANYACIRIIAKGVSSCPVSLYRKRRAGGSDVATEHPLHRLVHEFPHPRFTPSEFWDRVIVQMLVHGNFVGRLSYDGDQNVNEIQPFSWDQINAKLVRGRHVFVPTDPSEAAFTDADAFYLPGDNYDGLRGYSPLESCSAASRISFVAQQYVFSYFARGGVPPAYVSFPGPLSDEARESWRAWFRSKFQGSSNAGSIAVLDRAAEIKSINVDHTSMQLTELRRHAAEDACSIWGVPQHAAGILGKSTTHSNIEQQARELAIYCLSPIIRRIEDRLNKSLLGPRERQTHFFKFNMGALLRGDSQARGQLYSMLAQIGVMTPNEIRELEELNPVEHGDEPLVQGALVPLSKAGQHLDKERAK